MTWVPFYGFFLWPLQTFILPYRGQNSLTEANDSCLNTITDDINVINTLELKLLSAVFLSDCRCRILLHVLTRWLPMASFVAIVGRIYRYQLKCSYLKIQKHFAKMLLHFLESTLNFEHMSLMPEAFSKLLTPKDVVT